MKLLWRVPAALVLAGCSSLLGLEYDGAELAAEGTPLGPVRSGCTPAACNGQCGVLPDGCGGELRCAECVNGEQCGARGPNRCGPGACTAKTCAGIPGACGGVSDGCGKVLECGPCNSDAAPCPLPWDPTLLLPHGARIDAFQSETVPFRSTCGTETRTCANGVLSGSFAFESCAVAPPARCAFDGGMVDHDVTVTAYAAAQVPWNGSCQSQSRRCDNGELSGSYAFASCSNAPPPGFSCPDTALVRATQGCGAPPPQGPFFVHQIRCAGANVLTDTVQVIPSGGAGPTNYNYAGGSQSFSIPCVPGAQQGYWTLACQPVDAVIRCTFGTVSFDLPQQ